MRRLITAPGGIDKEAGGEAAIPKSPLYAWPKARSFLWPRLVERPPHPALRADLSPHAGRGGVCGTAPSHLMALPCRERYRCKRGAFVRCNRPGSRS